MDDLEVKPMSTISSITLHNKFNVKNIGALEEKVVKLGMDEVYVGHYLLSFFLLCTFYFIYLIGNVFLEINYFADIRM